MGMVSPASDPLVVHVVRDGIDRWVVVRVSWGSTLALVYALRHPRRRRGTVSTWTGLHGSEHLFV